MTDDPIYCECDICDSGFDCGGGEMTAEDVEEFVRGQEQGEHPEHPS